jgi:hypothetical protein
LFQVASSVGPSRSMDFHPCALLDIRWTEFSDYIAARGVGERKRYSRYQKFLADEGCTVEIHPGSETPSSVLDPEELLHLWNQVFIRKNDRDQISLTVGVLRGAGAARKLSVLPPPKGFTHCRILLRVTPRTAARFHLLRPRSRPRSRDVLQPRSRIRAGTVGHRKRLHPLQLRHLERGHEEGDGVPHGPGPHGAAGHRARAQDSVPAPPAAARAAAARLARGPAQASARKATDAGDSSSRSLCSIPGWPWPG